MNNTDLTSNKTTKVKREPKLTSFIIETLSSVATAFIAFFIILTFLFRPVCVDGSSMRPTLIDNDWLLISTGYYKPHYGDIVIISRELKSKAPLVKRVIGLEGDVIDIDFEKGIVYRNGEALEEPYTAEPTYLCYDVEFPLTVEENKVFVLGDNRNHSSDSRASDIGQINIDDILGKARYRVIPWGDFDIY